MELSAKTREKLLSWSVLGSHFPSEVAESDGRVAKYCVLSYISHTKLWGMCMVPMRKESHVMPEIISIE